MINFVYGIIIENLRKTIGVEVVNNDTDYLKHVSTPTLISTKIFDKNYAAIHEIKPVLTLNKPIYVGFTVLELSKWLMYDFHYNFIKKHFDAELLFTDTDSLMYEIKSEDVYEEFFKHKHLFDFSDYPKDSKFFDPTNKTVIDKMKVVSEGKLINEFVGLKSKMYSMKNIDGKESNTAKGVNIASEFHKTKDSSFNKKVVRHKMKRIKSKKKHRTGTYEINKISLSCFDDKRYVLNDGIHKLAYFHKVCIKQKISHIIISYKRFSQTIINKKRLSQIRRIQKNSHKKRRFPQKEEILTDDHKRFTQVKISE